MKHLKLFEEVTGTNDSDFGTDYSWEDVYRNPIEKPKIDIYKGEDWDEEEIDPNEDDVYKSNEHGVCPACGSNDLSYDGHPYIEDDEVYYEWVCRKCKFIGLEYYTLRFDEHYTADGARIRVGEPIDKDSYDN